jgi:uncharacterized protein YkwD
MRSNTEVCCSGEETPTKKWPEAKRVVGSTKKKRVEWSDSFAMECLEAHNQLRARHNSPPLSLSKKVSSFLILVRFLYKV